MKSFKLYTFGCQMNEHDSEKVRGVLAAKGMTAAVTAEEADFILLNTCSIREKAEQKFYSELGKLKGLKKKNPSLIIAVSGCIAQQEGSNVLKRAPHVDLILGNQNIASLPELLGSLKGEKPGVMTDFPEGYEHAVLPAGRESTVTAFVNVMYGCDNFCSYCVVPYVRGREKSRLPDDIAGEVVGLVAAGCREVTLLGQNVNSYGRGTVCAFPELLRMLDGVDGLLRIRFVTSHPKDLGPGLIEAMASLPKLCESLHLPLQSGSDKVLKAMNRGYTLDGYMEKIAMLKEAMPGITLSTDIIVGFPGETDEDFEKTVKVVEQLRYDEIYMFKYSRRPNTKALGLPGHLPEEVKDERLQRILGLQERIREENNSAMAGRVEEVLVEGPDKSGVKGRLTGRTRGGKIVNFSGDGRLAGTLVMVRITEGKKHSLVGSLV